MGAKQEELILQRATAMAHKMQDVTRMAQLEMAAKFGGGSISSPAPILNSDEVMAAA